MFISRNNEIFVHFLPHIRFFNPEESERIRDFMFQKFGIGESINWSVCSEYFFLKGPEEIRPSLEDLFGSGFDEKIYMLWDNGLLCAAKTSLENLLKNYEYLEKDGIEMWFWGAEVGYIMQYCRGIIKLGVLQKITDHWPFNAIEKNTLNTFPRLFHPIFSSLICSLGMEFISDCEANKYLKFFQDKFPFSPWGNIDWDKIEKKLIIEDDVSRIQDFLGTSFADHLNMSVFVDWRDSEIPLVKTNLNFVMEHFRVLRSVANEMFIFNPTARYVIEVRYPSGITVGVLPGSRESLEKLAK